MDSMLIRIGDKQQYEYALAGDFRPDHRHKAACFIFHKGIQDDLPASNFSQNYDMRWRITEAVSNLQET